MQLIVFHARFCILIGILMLATTSVATAQTAQKAAKQTLVEFWHVGDDMLSQRLTVETERAFGQSTDFKPSSGKRPGTLIVTVPHNVRFDQVGNRRKALFTVEFTSVAGRKLGERSGSCWADDMAKCAAFIVKEAKSAAAKMR